jgi:histidinol-phosphatase (PHP family)
MTQKSFLDMQKEKEAFEHKDIKLLAGVELGQALQDEAMAEKILSMCGFDFVIGSLHNLKGFEDFAFLDYHITENAAPVLVGKYFNELLELAQWNKFDVLGHLTYPLRYIQGVMKISLDMSSYEYIIDEILKIVIQNGKGIEINTSGLRQALGLTMPNKAIVKRYKDLGGEIITVGSDAHCTKDLGKGIADAYELLKECGFDHVCYFEQRKPMFIKI